MALRESWKEVDEALFPASDPNRPLQDVQRRHPLSKLQAWTLVLGGYLVMFGLGVWTGIGRLLNPDFNPGLSDGERIGFSVVQLVALAIVLVLLCRWAKLSLADLGLKIPRSRSQLWLEIKTGSMSEAASFFGFFIASALYLQVYGGTMAYPSTANTSAADWISDLLGSAVAGPTEEILLVVVLVFALRAACYSWTTVFVTGAVSGFSSTSTTGGRSSSPRSGRCS